ncbi:MAG: hypothetical protein OEM63_13670 [Gammaproteobacteria bacterium]|nr:hypothetical protein [Gammaproteobacteria bacterium]
MADENAIIEFIRKRDWRIWFGIVITVTWISGGLWYVIAISRSTPDQEFSLEVIGSFLEGAFAPLAFLWLVIGLFIQQRELANNSDALRKSSEQSEKQTLAIAATEMNARQGTFFKIKENVYQQLGGITGMLYASSIGPPGTGEMSREEMDANFKHVADGDCEVFARLFLTRGFLGEWDSENLFFGTDIRRRHARNYMRTFERLCRLAQNCDVDGIIEDSLMQNAFGLLYLRMRDANPEAKDPNSPADC